MIEWDKVYIINVNNLSKTVCFSTKKQYNTAERIATYFLGRTMALHLLCRPGYRSITLKSYLYKEMIKEIQEWLDSEMEEYCAWAKKDCSRD